MQKLLDHIRRLFLFTVLIFTSVPLLAETYYVSPNGLKTGDGSREKPWPVEIALAKGRGHTYIFLPGIYRDQIIINQIPSSSINNPTIFKSEVKWKAQIVGGPFNGLISIASNNPYVTIDGFEVWGGAYDGINSSSDYSTIRNCWIHNNGTNGIGIHNKKYAVIENNLIEFNGMHPQFHHGMYVDGSNHLIRGNILRYNAGYGIHLYPNIVRTRIENNLVYGHSNHAGIILVSTEGGEGIEVVNNTVVNNALGIEIWRCNDTIIENNILTGNQKTFLFLDNIKSSHVNYNLIDPSSEQIGDNNFKGNPDFIYAKRGIFWLNEKSAAIGRGNPKVAPVIDLWGRSRPKDRAPDLGSYQFIKIPSLDKNIIRWQYCSRFDIQELGKILGSGEMPDLWQVPTE